jgi:hypothetical protein
VWIEDSEERGAQLLGWVEEWLRTLLRENQWPRTAIAEPVIFYDPEAAVVVWAGDWRAGP